MKKGNTHEFKIYCFSKRARETHVRFEPTFLFTLKWDILGIVTKLLSNVGMCCAAGFQVTPFTAGGGEPPTL